VNWASGIDMKTGRPIENPAARYGTTGEQWLARPGPGGFHNWQPMAFNPETGLVYLPRQQVDGQYVHDPAFKPASMGENLGLDFGATVSDETQKKILQDLGGALLAWDPVKQEARWTIDDKMPGNGGVLTTAGNLVVQGLASGQVAIYRADNGKPLWSFPAQTGVMAGPVSYSVGGEQYIAVVAGWGGSLGLLAGRDAGDALGIAGRNVSRVLAFKLGGTAKLPPAPEDVPRALAPPPLSGSKETVASGSRLYARYCLICHASNAAASRLVPDLRYSAHLKDESWYGIVLGGALESEGMASFSPVLAHEDASAIRDYIIKEAHEAQAALAAPQAPPAPH
jgi:alcohol dehydrogenase (cytochrome c)/quinohemoprotein ethanol dehydrogenase